MWDRIEPLIPADRSAGGGGPTPPNLGGHRVEVPHLLALAGPAGRARLFSDRSHTSGHLRSPRGTGTPLPRGPRPNDWRTKSLRRHVRLTGGPFIKETDPGWSRSGPRSQGRRE